MWNSKSFVAVACFLPGRAKDLPAHLYCVAIVDTYWGSHTQNTAGSARGSTPTARTNLLYTKENYKVIPVEMPRRERRRIF